MRLPLRPSGTSPLMMRWGEAFTPSRSLADAGLTDEHCGLILRAARQHLQRLRRISSSRPITGSSLPLEARRGEVDGVFLERAALVLRLGSFTASPPRI